MNYFNQESKRLRFRKLTEEDIPLWLEFFIDNNSLDFLGFDTSMSHQELASGWIKAQMNRYIEQGLGHLAVELKDTGKFIAMGGIIPRTLLDKEEHEVAYSIMPNYWGKGYATEIATTMKDYGLANLKTERIISIIHIDNLASCRVAIKNGMKVLFRTDYLGMVVDVYGIEGGGT